jgi:hypothetical protein
MDTTQEPPSKEELLARLAALKERAEALNRRSEAQQRPKYGRIALALGIPVGAAVLTYVLTSSFGWAALALVGAIVLGVVAIAVLVPTPVYDRPGTRAFEARFNVKLLDDTIAARRAAQRQTRSVEEHDRLGREIAFLEKQRDEWRAVDPNDASPGRGYIGFTPYDGD